VPELGVQVFRYSGIQGSGGAPPEDLNTRTPEHLNTRTPLRVAWIAEIPVPYRVGLYRRLREPGARGAGGGLDLKLFFCSATQKDRDWTVSLEGVPHVVLRGATAAVRPREQFFLRINPQVWPELSRFRPDVVVVGGYAHVTMQLAMLWCLRTGTPYAINSETHERVRGQGSGGRGQSGKGLRSRASLTLPFLSAVGCRLSSAALKRFFVRRAGVGLPAGTLARDYLISLGGPAKRMFILPNTCPVDQFARESACARRRRAALREELGLGPGPVVLFVGRLTPAKGLDTLLRAFANIRCSGVQVFRCSGGVGPSSEHPNT
jgi:glycosyltransferase involved in cell wall biosynthesis